MKTSGNGIVLAFVLSAAAWGAEKKLKLESLPAAVQSAVKEQTRNATLVGVTKEVEGGQTMYEVETKVNGKGRDLMLDKNGAVVTVEEEIALDSIPGPAKEAIQKKVSGGNLKMVELVTKGSDVSYEASYVGKNGKAAEFGVNADGSVHK